MLLGKGSTRWACGFLCVSESVCVCLNLSVCVCALEPPPQKSRDASSGGGCPVWPLPLLLNVPSQEPLPWAPLQAGPGSTKNIEVKMGQPSRQPQVELTVRVCLWSPHLSGRLVEIKELRPGNRPDVRSGPPRFQSIVLCNIVSREGCWVGSWARHHEQWLSQVMMKNEVGKTPAIEVCPELKRTGREWSSRHGPAGVGRSTHH